MNCLSGYSIDGLTYPSISKVLASNPQRKSAIKSSALHGRRLSSAEAKRRGSAVHEALRNFIKTGECDLESRYLCYWYQLQELLNLLEPQVLWSDGPLDPSLSYLEQDNHSCVWSSKLRVQGCPDLFGTVGGVKVVGELKTGTVPFINHYPFKQFHEYWPYYKFNTAAMQLAGYSICLEETIGFKPEAGLIMNVMPEANQLFILEADELAKYKAKFKKLTKSFFKGEGCAYTMQDNF